MIVTTCVQAPLSLLGPLIRLNLNIMSTCTSVFWREARILYAAKHSLLISFRRAAHAARRRVTHGSEARCAPGAAGHDVRGGT